MDALEGMWPLRQGRRTDLEPPDNVRKSNDGNSAAYLIRRLQRDAPEIAEALAAGSLAFSPSASPGAQARPQSSTHHARRRELQPRHLVDH